MSVSVPTDHLLTAAALIATTFTSMRLFYSAWPWEANKTWYRTRHAVEYLTLQRAQSEPPSRHPLGNDVTSNDNFADSLPNAQRQADYAFEDSFDRSLIMSDETPPEGATPSVASTEQLTPRESSYGVQIS